MSTWTAPATWVAAAVTAASMNTEIRDHDTFLKGSLDLLTNTTTADTGYTMSLGPRVATTASGAYFAFVTTDSVARFAITGAGALQWGDGATTRDVAMSRTAVNVLTLESPSTLDLASTALGLHLSGGGYVEMLERAALGNPAANKARLWIQDNGVGKSQLAIRFATGSIQIIATEP